MEKINTCRTTLGIMLQAAKLLGRPHSFPKYTTLNERFDIHADAHQDLTEVPNLGYYCIGIGGHRMIIDDKQIPVDDPVSHETTNTGLFKPMPFVLRQLNDDLPATQRVKYALRRKETYNGTEYWAYYLKRLAKINEAPEVIHDNTKDGVTTSKPFDFTNEDLYPTPSDLPPVGVVVASADIIRISAKVEIDFSEQDVLEYLNVCKIMYGSEKYAVISEIGICSGVDKTISADGESNSTIAFKEAIGVQVNVFISTYIPISKHNRGFYHEFELGEGEPLLVKGETRSTRYSADVKPSETSRLIPGTTYDASNPENGRGRSTTPTITGNTGSALNNAGTPPASATTAPTSAAASNPSPASPAA